MKYVTGSFMQFEGNDQVPKREGNHKMPFSKEADTHNFYFNRFSLPHTLQGSLLQFDLRSFLLTETKHLLYAQHAI